MCERVLTSNMPKVSVIIPTHNRAHFLRGAILSVLNQTFQDFEIIVVDDASTDNTSEVVAAFNDERIRFLRHDTNKGGSAARNTGILNSQCDYIAFLDDDDEWLPEKLGKQMDILLASPPDVGGVYTGYVMVDRASGRVIDQRLPTKRGDLSKDLLISNCIGGTSSVLLRKNCLQKVGLFDENLPRSQDFDLWLRIANVFLFEYVPEPLYKYYIHENRISTNLDVLSRGLEIVAKKYKDLPLSKTAYSKEYMSLGVMFCLAGNAKEGRKALVKSIKMAPFRIKHYSYLCLSVLGADNLQRLIEMKDKLRSKKRRQALMKSFEGENLGNP
jgi:glycosyltransferase involved in cell wall biosynthesis